MPVILGVNILWFLSVIPFLILTVAARVWLEDAFIKYGAMLTMFGMSGEKIARALLREKEIDDVDIERSQGTFSDGYAVRSKTINLSELAFAPNSVMATAIAAIEAGHAIIHKESPLLQKLRAVANFVGKFGARMLLVFMVFGILLEALYFLKIGVVIYIVGSLLQLFTLFVEFRAKKIGLSLLKETGYIMESEAPDVSKAISAAAFINEADTAISLTYFIRLVLNIGSGRSTRG